MTTSIAKQVPKVVRVAMGTTVSRIRIELIFRRCCNLITPSRSQGALRAQVRAYFNDLLIDVNLRFNFVPPCSS